ncbi:Equistatin [Exaiptasia diaphana]|nr:Equistatin [Exaiptasia diaphana]
MLYIKGTRLSDVATVEASPGLIPSPCQQEQIRQKYTPRTSDSYTPRCKTDGSYDEIQCDATQGQCWCVDKDGLELDGMRTTGLLICPSKASPGLIPSPCQQEQIRQKYTPRTSDSYTPRCKTDGSYDEIQCDATQGQCWCVDKDGLELDGMRTTGLLICPSKAPLTRCQAERQRSLESLDSPVKLFIPRCNVEGGFEEIQCHGLTGQCWCVDVNGIEIIGSVTFGTKPDCTAKAKMTSCERHRVVAMGMTGKPSPSRYVPQCTHEGKYNEVQCHTGTGLCWCVDTEGREIIGTRAWGHQQCKDTPTDSNTLPLDIAVLFPPTSSKTTLRAIQTFLRSLVSSFEVSHRGTHFSFVVSSEAPYSPLTFSKFGSEDEFTAENINKIIDDMKIDFCASKVNRGIHFIDQQIFTVLSGMRGLADKVLIVLIDNQQAPNQGRHTPLSTLSEDLQSKNINIYAIGISNQVDVAELMDIASAPRNVFTLKDYENLALNGKEIVHVINNDTRNYLKDSNTLPLDIAVLFPPTSSKTTLRAIQTFLRSLVSSFEVSHRGTHFSFVVSSEAPYAPLTFSKFDSEDDFTAENTNKIINDMKIDFCASRVDRGVHFIDQQIFTVLSGMRGLADKFLAPS